MKKYLATYLFQILALSLYSSSTLGAACCGGGFSFPSLILSDDKAQVTFSTGVTQIRDDIQANGKWLRRQDDNSTQLFKIEVASLTKTFSPHPTWEHFQIGLSLQGSHKESAQNNSHFNLGDTSLSLAHESFPELYFSKWKPHGVSFLQITFPTGTSIYEESDFTKLDGRGFYNIAAGVALTKAMKLWDYSYSGNIHHSLSRKASGSQYNGEVNITPGLGTVQTLSAGYNFKNLRGGTYLSFSFNEPTKISGDISSAGSPEKSFTTGLVLNYLHSSRHAFTLNYSNQRLIGNPRNTALSEGVLLSYQLRTPR